MAATPTQQVSTAPERRKVSYDDYRQEASETSVTEWVDGEVIAYRPPFLRHQEISWFLLKLVGTFVEMLKLGIVGAAPFEVRLHPDGPSREPDLFL